MPNGSPTHAVLAPRRAGDGIDPALERLLRGCLAAGLLAVLLVLALRGANAWLGWWPMWLVAMPGTAWWALHRFRLPRARRGTESAGRHRRAGRQARRWTRPATAILRPAA